MILLQKFPPDLRVEKESEVLTKNGYRVIVFATQSGGKPTRNHGTEVVYVKGKRDLLAKGLLSIFKTVSWYEKQILKWIRENNIHPTVIHVHDLLWAYLGYRISKILKAKLFLDFHENYPAAIQIRCKNQLDKGNIISRIEKLHNKASFFRCEQMEKLRNRYDKKSDASIVVVEEALERFLENPRKK